MKKCISIVVLVGFLFMLSGCAAIFKGNRSSLQATSNPSGAKVYVNGKYYGDTPIKLKLKSSESYTIEFKKEGFKTVKQQVDNHVGAGWIVLDVICGLVPVIVDAATGSWYHLDQEHVNAELERQQP